MSTSLTRGATRFTRLVFVELLMRLDAVASSRVGTLRLRQIVVLSQCSAQREIVKDQVGV